MSTTGDNVASTVEIGAVSPSGAADAAMTAADLTNQLLDYAGKASFEREELDLSTLVRDVTNLLSVNIPKDINVSFDLPEGLREGLL